MGFEISLEGKRALVTGASGGLGERFAHVLARAGAKVAVAARRESECRRVRDAIIAAGGEAAAIVMDVTRAASATEGVAQTEAELGGLDILVNNAGLAGQAPALDMSEADWDRIVDTNLKGAFLMAQAAARAMRTGGGGAIVNIASILGVRVAAQLSAYAASKAALTHLTKALALEWARYNVRVNALCPGYIETEINRGFFATDAGQALIKRVPQRRLGRPEELDGPLLLLCSDAGSFMTGAAVVVDGGHVVSSL